MFFPVDRKSLTEATSGAIGALVSTIVLYPLDTCKTKLQAELQTHQGMHKYRYDMYKYKYRYRYSSSVHIRLIRE